MRLSITILYLFFTLSCESGSNNRGDGGEIKPVQDATGKSSAEEFVTDDTSNDDEGNTKESAYLSITAEPRVSPAAAAISDVIREFTDSVQKKVKSIVKVPVFGPTLKFRVIEPGENRLSYLRAAFEAAKNGNYKKLVLPKARYVLIPLTQNAPQNTFYLDLDHYKDLEFDGSGSTFVLRRAGSFARLAHCERIMFKNFSIEYDIRLASKAFVKNDGGKKVLRPIGEYLTKIKSTQSLRRVESLHERTTYTGKRFPYKKYASKRWMKYSGSDYFSFDATSEAFIPSSDSILEKWDAGTQLLLKHFEFDGYGFFILAGEDIIIENITFSSVPGALIYANSLARGLAVINNRTQFKTSDTADLLTGSAGGINIHHSGGDIIIENNHLNNLGGDGIHIHSQAYQLAAMDPQKITLKGLGSQPLFDLSGVDGEYFLIFDQGFKYLGDIKTTQFHYADSNEYHFAHQSETTFPNGSIVVRPDWNGRRFYIRGNSIENNNGRGVIIQSSSGLIYQNTFDTLSGAAVWLTSDFEGLNDAGPATNITVSANTITNTGFSALYKWGLGLGARFMGAISISTHLNTANNHFSRFGVHKNILIQDNNIESVEGPGIQVSSAEHVLVKNNKIVDANKNGLGTTEPGKDIGRPVKGGIMIFDSQDVHYQNNDLSGSSEPLFEYK